MGLKVLPWKSLSCLSATTDLQVPRKTSDKWYSCNAGTLQIPQALPPQPLEALGVQIVKLVLVKDNPRQINIARRQRSLNGTRQPWNWLCCLHSHCTNPKYQTHNSLTNARKFMHSIELWWGWKMRDSKWRCKVIFTFYFIFMITVYLFSFIMLQLFCPNQNANLLIQRAFIANLT